MQRVTQYSPADSTTSTGYESNNSDSSDHISPSTMSNYNRPYSCYSNPPPAFPPMYGAQATSSFQYHAMQHNPRNYMSTVSSGLPMVPHQTQIPYWTGDMRASFPPSAYCSSYLDSAYPTPMMSSSCSPRQPTQDCMASESESDGGGPIKLWQFLLELLQNSEGVNCIEWTNNNPYEFRFTDRVEVARLWGKRKNKPKMNYEKLARSLRYYYGKDMIEKGQPGEKYVYHFTKNLMSKEYSVSASESH